MASELYVETLKGLTSGANANKVIVPAGQTLDASAGSVTLPAGVGGKVLQVVQATSATEYNSQTGSEVYTGYSAAITPSFTSSKILVTVSAGVGETGTTSNWAFVFKLRRGISTSDTQLVQHRHGHYEAGATESSEGYRSMCLTYLDSPNTTSEVTYGLFVANVDGAPNARVNKNGGPLVFLLQEIAG